MVVYNQKKSKIKNQKLMLLDRIDFEMWFSAVISRYAILFFVTVQNEMTS